MGDQGCSELLAQDTAARFFQTAALLVGNEAEAVSLVEEAIAGVEVDPCADGEAANALVQNEIVQAAIRLLSEREPQAFAAPEPIESGPASCIEGDDLAASGLSPDQLKYLLEGEGRDRLRHWLEHLPAIQRTVFVERAMLGRDNVATAENLRSNGGSNAANWTPDKVSEIFRQALCSLTTSLVQAGAAQHA
jgi:DNA-directed RNA polymerase specialized sigma24 family protein